MNTSFSTSAPLASSHVPKHATVSIALTQNNDAPNTRTLLFRAGFDAHDTTLSLSLDIDPNAVMSEALASFSGPARKAVGYATLAAGTALCASTRLACRQLTRAGPHVARYGAASIRHMCTMLMLSCVLSVGITRRLRCATRILQASTAWTRSPRARALLRRALLSLASACWHATLAMGRQLRAATRVGASIAPHIAPPIYAVARIAWRAGCRTFKAALALALALSALAASLYALLTALDNTVRFVVALFTGLAHATSQAVTATAAAPVYIAYTTTCELLGAIVLTTLLAVGCTLLIVAVRIAIDACHGPSLALRHLDLERFEQRMPSAAPPPLPPPPPPARVTLATWTHLPCAPPAPGGLGFGPRATRPRVDRQFPAVTAGESTTPQAPPPPPPPPPPPAPAVPLDADPTPPTAPTVDQVDQPATRPAAAAELRSLRTPLKFASLNVRYLTESNLQLLLHEMDERALDVVAVQETHAPAERTETWRERGYCMRLFEGLPLDTPAPTGATTHAGVGFLWRADLDVEVTEVVRGRLAVLTLVGLRGRPLSRRYSVACVYVPPGQKPTADVLGTIQEVYTALTATRAHLVMGDFNYDAKHASDTRAAAHDDFIAAGTYSDALPGCRTATTWTSARRVVDDDSTVTQRRLDYMYMRGNLRTTRGCAFVQWSAVDTDHKILGTSIRLENVYNGKRATKPRKVKVVDPLAGGTAETSADTRTINLCDSYNALVAAVPALTATRSVIRRKNEPPPLDDVAREALLLRNAARARLQCPGMINDDTAAAHKESHRVASRRLRASLRHLRRRQWTEFVEQLGSIPADEAVRALRPLIKGSSAKIPDAVLASLPQHYRKLLSGAARPDDVAETLDAVAALKLVRAAKNRTAPGVPIVIVSDGSYDREGAGIGANGPGWSACLRCPPDAAHSAEAAELLSAVVALEHAYEQRMVAPALITLVNDCALVRKRFNDKQLAGSDFPVRDSHLIQRLHRIVGLHRQRGTRVEIVPPSAATELAHQKAHSLANTARKDTSVPLAALSNGPLIEAPAFPGPPDEDVTMDELRNVLSCIASRKATGPDNIQGSVFKAAIPLTHCLDPALANMASTLLTQLLDLMNHVLQTGEIPVAWRRSEIVPLAKTPVPKDGGDTRGISLISHVSKVFSALVARRLSSCPLATWQCGFRPKRGTMHAAAVLQQLLQLHRYQDKELHCVFIDCSKAFDTVDRELMLAALKAHGVGDRILRALKNLYTDDVNYVRGHENDTFASTAGVKQGDNASPVLFVMVLDIIVHLAKLETFRVPCVTGPSLNATVFGYADDLVLSHTDPAALQRNLDKLVAALAKFGLKVNAKKTESFSLDRDVPRQAPTLLVNGAPIAVVTVFKYLGRMVDSAATDKKDMTRRIAAGRRALLQLGRILLSQPLTLAQRTAVLNQYTYPTMLYGSETWQPTLADRRKIAAVQTTALRLIARKSLTKTTRRVPVQSPDATVPEDSESDADSDEDARATRITEQSFVEVTEYKHFPNAALFELTKATPILEMMDGRQLRFAQDISANRGMLPERRAGLCIPHRVYRMTTRQTLYEHYNDILQAARVRKMQVTARPTDEAKNWCQPTIAQAFATTAEHRRSDPRKPAPMKATQTQQAPSNTHGPQKLAPRKTSDTSRLHTASKAPDMERTTGPAPDPHATRNNYPRPIKQHTRQPKIAEAFARLPKFRRRLKQPTLQETMAKMEATAKKRARLQHTTAVPLPARTLRQPTLSFAGAHTTPTATPNPVTYDAARVATPATDRLTAAQKRRTKQTKATTATKTPKLSFPAHVTPIERRINQQQQRPTAHPPPPSPYISTFPTPPVVRIPALLPTGCTPGHRLRMPNGPSLLGPLVRPPRTELLTDLRSPNPRRPPSASPPCISCPPSPSLFHLPHARPTSRHDARSVCE